MPTVELTVGAPAHGGHCVARTDGRVVFVRHSLPGERVLARLTESDEGASFWRADAVEILEASPDRVVHPWVEAGPGGVGGAELGHVSLEGQLRWKSAVLDESFERFAGRGFPGAVESVAGGVDGLRSRNRVTAVASAEGGVAMHLHRSKRLARITAMPLAIPDVERALLDVRAPAGAAVTVAQGTQGDPVVIVDGAPFRRGHVDPRPNARRKVTHTVTTDAGSWDFAVEAGGFWQSHVGAASALLSQVMSRVEPGVSVLDLYSGAGLFAVPLASQGHAVVAVESDGAAARSAKRNAHDTTARIEQADTRDFLRAQEEGSAHTVVLDPPRSGAGRATLDALAAIGPQRIVYVACDPVALARDTALLADRGYDLVDAQALDLFPMTHHVEAVATFEVRP